MNETELRGNTRLRASLLPICRDRAGHNFPTGPPVRSHHLSSNRAGQRLTAKHHLPGRAANSIAATTASITRAGAIWCQVTSVHEASDVQSSTSESGCQILDGAGCPIHDSAFAVMGGKAYAPDTRLRAPPNSKDSVTRPEAPQAKSKPLPTSMSPRASDASRPTARAPSAPALLLHPARGVLAGC
jgi:hypothetical protein